MRAVWYDRGGGDTRDQRLQCLRDVRRRQPQRTRAILIDVQADGGQALVPVEVGIDCVFVALHTSRTR